MRQACPLNEVQKKAAYFNADALHMGGSLGPDPHYRQLEEAMEDYDQ